MSSQDVFWINAGLGLAFVALFMVRRGNRQPTRLNLRAQAERFSGGSKERHPVPAARGSKRPYLHLISPEALEAQSLSPQEKSLNVLFNYNGHTWDAFEILGIPAGSSLKVAEEAHRKAHAKSSPEARDFIDSAFQAIRSQSRRDRGA